LHKFGTTEEQTEKAIELLKMVGLKPEDLKKFPHEFSGGQRQRIGIARALALNPKVIVADEPIAALDVSIQAQVLNLLSDLKKKFNLTYIFISHDLSVVKYFSDRVAVMYLGKIVELTTAERIYANPRHPYTRALMSAILKGNPEEKVQHEILEGDVPSPINPPSGCAFHPRCRFAKEDCKSKAPELNNLNLAGETHLVSCHRVNEI
jgi:oligopeptide/dipeptide ABC transporter ATP-binding protein